MNFIMIILKKHSNNSRLLFTDTDSLIYETKTEDVNKTFCKEKKFLILVIIQLRQNFMIILTN